jgi:hypothetical protein
VAILEGDLAPEDLVKLTPHELATDEQKDARDAESKASTLERRADYYQIARAGIQVCSDAVITALQLMQPYNLLIWKPVIIQLIYLNDITESKWYRS